MKYVEFNRTNVTVAENQPEYNPMPGLAFGDRDGTKLFCCQFTWRERIKLLFTGKLWHYILTHGNLQQPTRLTVDRPPCLTSTEDIESMHPFLTNIVGCSACGKDHDEVMFTPSLIATDYHYTHEGICPTSRIQLFSSYAEDQQQT